MAAGDGVGLGVADGAGDHAAVATMATAVGNGRVGRDGSGRHHRKSRTIGLAIIVTRVIIAVAIAIAGAGVVAVTGTGVTTVARLVVITVARVRAVITVVRVRAVITVAGASVIITMARLAITNADEEVADGATAVEAELVLGGVGKFDVNLGGQAKVEEIEDANVEVDSDTGANGKLVLEVNNAVVSLTEGDGVSSEISPDGNLSTGVEKVKSEQVDTSADADVRAKTKAKLDLDLGGQVDTSTDADGKGVGKEAVELGSDDLLGNGGDVDVVTSSEGNVETGRQVNSSTNTDDEIEGEGGTKTNLEKTSINLKLGGGDQLDGLVDSSVGRDIDLEVGLDAGEIEADQGDLEVGADAIEANMTLNLGLVDVETEVDRGVKVSNAARG